MNRLSPPAAADVTIPRIGADPVLFREQYVAKRRPVVVQGIFASSALSAMTTMPEVRASVGTGRVGVRGNYMNGMMGQLESFINGTVGARDLYSQLVSEKKVSIAEYMDLVAASAGREPFMKYVNEQPPPPEVMGLLGMPSFFEEIGVPALVPAENNPTLDALLPEAAGRCVFFMANAGNAADAHSDWDGRHVINHQVVGRKRFVLVPPESGLKLSAVEAFLMPRFRHMPDEERHALLRYAGGAECILEPGDAIYMPPFYFHHIDYLTDAIGVAIRFGAPARRIINLMVETHRDLYLQNVWARITREPSLPAHVAAVDRIEQALLAHHASRLAKYSAIRDLCRDLCTSWKIFPGGDSHLPWVSQSDLLERPLSTAYIRPPDAWSKPKQQWWRIKETSRLAAATVASRVVSLIEGPAL